MAQWRSGIPHHINGTTPALGAMSQPYDVRTQTTRFVFHNTDGGGAIELFLTDAAAAAGAGNGITVNASTGMDLEIEIARFWVRSAVASRTFEVLAIGRG